MKLDPGVWITSHLGYILSPIALSVLELFLWGNLFIKCNINSISSIFWTNQIQENLFNGILPSLEEWCSAFIPCSKVWWSKVWWSIFIIKEWHFCKFPSELCTFLQSLIHTCCQRSFRSVRYAGRMFGGRMSRQWGVSLRSNRADTSHWFTHSETSGTLKLFQLILLK